MQEIESLRPIDYDEFLQAADLLKHFGTYWAKCAEVSTPDEARKQLLAKIVDRVFVYNRQVVAVVLHGDFAILLGKKHTTPADLQSAIRERIMGTKKATHMSSQDGDDGVRTRDLCLDRAVC